MFILSKNVMTRKNVGNFDIYYEKDGGTSTRLELTLLPEDYFQLFSLFLI